MRLPKISTLRFLAVVLLTGSALGSCADSGTDIVRPSDQPSFATASSDQASVSMGPSQAQDLTAAIRAANQHTEALMSRPGVVGTGVGLNPSGQPVLKVFVMNAGVTGIPAQVDGVGVITEVTGMFMARTDPISKARPASLGFSIGHPDVTAGTLGARVTDGTNVFILSNNHVIANSNDASIGDPTLQPGAYDGGTDPADVIGTLHDFVPIDFSGGDNTMDAGLSLVDPSDVSGVTPAESYGAPGMSPATALLGMQVQKYGRTTEHTEGEVAELNVTVSVCYEAQGPFFCKKAATFVDQFTVTPGSFSEGGDSGSLIVDGNNDPVGLLFAGSATRTIANPIEPVLSHFGVSIDPTVVEGGGGEDPNSPPTASFTYTCSDLTCDFDATGSSDTDGSIVSYDWDFGDTAEGSGLTVSHTYAAGGTYTVVLTVTADGTASDSASEDVTVSEAPPAGGFSLEATAYKVRGLHKADLSWSGATSTNVDVFRNGELIATTANDGFETDHIDQRGSGSYTYQLCEAGTSTCSNEATVTL